MKVSLVVTGGTVVTMNGKRQIFRDGFVAIDGQQIIDVGRRRDLKGKYEAAHAIDATDRMVIPGLIDAHNHPIHFVSRGIADDLEMTHRSYERVWPYERNLTPDEAYISAACTFVEMISNGTTCFADPGSHYPASVAAAARDVGIRGIVAYEEWDIEESRRGRLYGESSEEALEKAEEVVERWNATQDGRLRAWFSLVRPAHVSDELCVRTKERADALGVGIHAHLHVWPPGRESEEIIGAESAISRYANLGVLGPNLLTVHLGTVIENEVALLKGNDVKAVHCPSASMLGGFGVIALGTFPEMIDAGLTIGLGTDGGAISRFIDMVRVMYLAACGHKDARMNPTAVGAYKAFEMTTIEGARALLWDEDIGSLEPGKKADVAILDVDGYEWHPNPLDNPISNLVYSATGRSTRTVIVDGRVIMEDCVLNTIDAQTLMNESNGSAKQVLARLGIEVGPNWPVVH
jgi:5-methylthioadenosine/S-adenosylhomocysteine deaminase